MREAIVLTYEISYSHLAQIESISKTGVFKIAKIEYTDKITLDVSGDIDQKQSIIDTITEVTAGKCKLLKEKSRKNKFLIDSD